MGTYLPETLRRNLHFNMVLPFCHAIGGHPTASQARQPKSWLISRVWQPQKNPVELLVLPRPAKAGLGCPRTHQASLLLCLILGFSSWYKPCGNFHGVLGRLCRFQEPCHILLIGMHEPAND